MTDGLQYKNIIFPMAVHLLIFGIIGQIFPNFKPRRTFHMKKNYHHSLFVLFLKKTM